MPYRVNVTQSAREDARDYAAFVRDKQRSPMAARRWLAGLQAALGELEENPERYSTIPEVAELGLPYRSFVYHSHRIVYLVDHAERRVTIHRVYHGARKPLSDRDFS